MEANERREKIKQLLKNENDPISATSLAKKFNVSRQVVVGDIALLRAWGNEIMATPRGYVVIKKQTGLIKRIACKHSQDEMLDELNAIVDNGCTILDVIVEHPVYGEISGQLQISNRYEVNQFEERCKNSSAKLLSNLTGGIHLHTVSCPNEQSYQHMLISLKAKGILIEG